jgi:hypothetical protein
MPEWMHGNAQRYAGYGAVAVAVEYQLCDLANITPLDTMADVRDNANELGIDESLCPRFRIPARRTLLTQYRREMRFWVPMAFS